MTIKPPARPLGLRREECCPDDWTDGEREERNGEVAEMPDVLGLHPQAAPLLYRLNAVLALHKQTDDGFCTECGTSWKCRTYLALTAATDDARPTSSKPPVIATLSPLAEVAPGVEPPFRASATFERRSRSTGDASGQRPDAGRG